MKSFFYVTLLFLLTVSLKADIPKSFYKAVNASNLKKVKKLINSKNVNLRNKDNETILNYAIIKGNIKIVKYLISVKADLNNKASIKYKIIKNSPEIIRMKTDNGDTPLILAIKLQNNDIIKLLIKNKAKINLKETSNTPLNVALQTQNIKIIKLLLQNKAKVNPEYETWNTPLIVAISTENKNLVKILIENGADINKPNINDVTPLEYSFGIYENPIRFNKKRFEIIKLLIKKGAKFRDETLYNAIRTNSDELIDFLIKKGIKPSKNNKYNEFKLAVKLKNLNILKKLLKLKNTKEVLNISLFYAVKEKYNYTIINFLLSKGANPNYIDPETQKNILINAIESNDIHNVKMIVQAKGNVNYISKYGYTPLMASINNFKITNYLLNHGAKANLYNPNNPLNILSFAIIHGKNNNDVIKLLIEKKASKKNALFYAAKRFNTEIITLLLKQGVNINKKHKKTTPLTAAIQEAVTNKKDFNKNPDIKNTIKILIAHGGKINKNYLQSDEFKKNKLIYRFVIKEMKKL